ncbi:MAG: SH3 domain-containing protein [[Clostridium] aminophilum]|uniref:SH3 domain-containing protein n=1 Tax=[Clostridium] aminophilum TaxID=1526 RepID=UPI0026EB2EA0|nr:SH3 domain-containing protein [[Clostridium] aminophilum]MDD6195381.1 SH3 domain-containing protein [[Clostridium] aminophilum]
MNKFREWLSDNLRYLLLVIGLLAVLVGLFFGVRAVSRQVHTTDQNAADSGSIQLTANTVTVTPTATPSVSAVSSSSSLAESVAENPALTKDAVPEVTTLMSNYYEAVSSGDVTAVKKLVDTLPEDEATKISSSSTKYSDIEVYTKPGYTADSYVVYTKYNYTNAGSKEALPGLSQSYVKKADDGNYMIVFSDVDKETADYISKVTKEQDVQDLISKVKAEYEKAVSASKAAAAASVQTESSGSGQSAASSSSSQSATTDQGQTAGTDETSLSTGSSASVSTSQDTGTENQDQETADQDDGDQADDQGQVLEEDTDAADNNGGESTRTGTILSTVNVRSGPGFEYQVISEVAGGSKVTVIGDNDKGWWHVITDSAEGYVGQSYISVS